MDYAQFRKVKCITADKDPSPSNLYGDSKWQADQEVRKLDCDTFHIAVLRPPMIYGKGSKGNYPTLSSMAKKLPVFPDIENERSMLYIDNLTEFLCQLMMDGRGGIFFPQNAEYTRTSEMVKMIAEVSGHRIRASKAWNWVVALAVHIPGKISGLANKAFGNMSYDQSMSSYDFEYRVCNLKESIERTEG